MLGRTVRRYRSSASAIAVPIVTAIIGVLIICFLQSAITTLIAYTLIALSAAALALVIINNERAYYRPPTILSLANDGGLPLVSVVIPAHNEDGTVSQAIESVLDQTYPRTEVIVVDDGSTDNTAEIASGYAERYPDRVKIVKHEKNLGKFEALNSGMDEARGELIYHMDADGYLAPDNIERMVSAFNDGKIGAAASMVAISNDRNALTRLQQIEYFFEQLIVRFSQAIGRNVIICPGAGSLFKKESVKDFRVSDRTLTEDADYSFEVRKRGWKASQEVDAVSFTEAPEDLKSFTRQRIRWLYGVLQTITRHRWSLKDPWVIWAWLGYILTPLAMILLFSIPVLGIILGQAYLAYFLPYFLIGFIVFFVSRLIPLGLYRYRGKAHLIPYIPLYLLYNTYLAMITLYCFMAWLLRKGVKIRYGNRTIHAK
ncbi:MAG: hypothetical protein DRN59_02025 [Thaumarchaeota archaeon]|nr:MAG: hypothetical protein DRN59_02025 [Nitrososphaerota archaeon]